MHAFTTYNSSVTHPLSFPRTYIRVAIPLLLPYVSCESLSLIVFHILVCFGGAINRIP